MSLRETIRERPAVGLSVVGVATGFCLLLLYMNSASSGSTRVFFYDLNAGQLVLAKSDDVSPAVDSPSRFSFADGEAGSWVRAAIYECEDTPSQVREGMTLEQVVEAGARIVWLERISVDALALIEKRENAGSLSDAEMNRLVNAPTLVASPEDLQWVPENSAAGRRIMSSLGSFCPTGKPRFVTP